MGPKCLSASSNKMMDWGQGQTTQKEEEEAGNTFVLLAIRTHS
jgi:hypothetical protein